MVVYLSLMIQICVVFCFTEEGLKVEESKDLVQETKPSAEEKTPADQNV